MLYNKLARFWFVFEGYLANSGRRLYQYNEDVTFDLNQAVKQHDCRGERGLLYKGGIMCARERGKFFLGPPLWQHCAPP